MSYNNRNSRNINIEDRCCIAFFDVNSSEIIKTFQSTNIFPPSVDDIIYFGQFTETGTGLNTEGVKDAEIENRETNITSEGEHYVVVDRQFGYLERDVDIEDESIIDNSMATLMTIFVEPHDPSEEDEREEFRIPDDENLY
jgi:hypothetical protein